MRSKITTIKLRKNTVQLLNSLKVHPRQPYDEIITLLLESHGTSKIGSVSNLSGTLTTIKLSKSNASALSELKIHPSQSYEEVVVTLAKKYSDIRK